MTTIARIAPLGAICMMLVGCATVTRGANTSWEVRTEPPGASVSTSNGRVCEKTPCTLQMSRKAEFTAKIQKPGYRTVTVQVDHNMSAAGGAALIGNVVLGGLIGVAIDMNTGAANDLSPSNLALNLEAEPPSEQAFQTAVNTKGWAPLHGEEYDWRTLRRTGYSRVTELKVLPGGSTMEFHEDGSVTEMRADGSDIDTRSPSHSR